MKVNEDKSHLLVFGSKDGEVSASILGSLIQESDEEKLLGVKLDRGLNFKTRVSNLCNKASQKQHALARVSKYMEKSKLELTMTSLLMSHLRVCCSFVWVFHDKESYNKINKIYERALKIIHRDSTSNFEGLLIKSNSVSVHQRNLQLLLIEIYKTINNLNPSFMAEVIAINFVPYNLLEAVILFYPKLGQACMALILSGFLAKNYGRICQKKSKIPKHLRSLKEILRPYLFNAAANYEKVLLQT